VRKARNEKIGVGKKERIDEKNKRFKLAKRIHNVI
jgi:hypothetical protein